ncbi:MAG: YegS/Rv2252/BmrU family lipid kinase [Candidatus Heimdallarchaeum endolithica]|uniref:YegS/Rv2252/BmrU family lipid kinase n=1 Tax=Candidatus Heimdallarchaeum endolithica TaxID=2876572 RepID=A0A9Y1BVX4_9ARCH|nr:MAG: YegS/Rv2252/BmrU family lipid kinase [Candidatus Heimdallarchaeum endolithica]
MRKTLRKKVNHATEITKDNIKDFDVFVSCGEDGTVNGIINGLAETDKTLGILPIGNGNDYATLLSVKGSYIQALNILEENKKTELNLGFAIADTKHYFANIAETGITSVIAKASYTELKWIKGLPKYYILGLKKISSYKPIQAHIRVDNYERKTKLIVCAIGLGYRFGGGFNVLPGNKPYFGDFQVCIAGDVPKWKWYWMINKIKNGTHGDIKGVNFVRGKKIEIETEKQLPIEGEGEVFSENSTKATFELSQSKLKIIVGKEFLKNKIEFETRNKK